MSKHITAALVLAAFTITARAGTPEQEENWAQWRGPNYNGTAPKADPPIEWSDTKNIKWKADLPGRGSATPIVWGDNVFVVAAEKTDRVVGVDDVPKFESKLDKKTKAPQNFYRFVVLCLDRNTGRPKWTRVAAEKVPHEGHHETHSYAAGSPTTDGKYLYVSFGSFGIYCYDFAGNLRWTRDLGRLSTRLGWGEAVTPVIHGDDLVLNWDQEENAALIVLNARTGDTRWKKERDERSTWTTPMIVEHAGKTQVIVNGTKKVRSYDLATGELLWQFGGMTINAIPSVVTADGIAYCMSGYGGFVGMAVPLESRGELDAKAFLWQIGKGTPYVSSPLLTGSHLVFLQANTPVLTILDRNTGKALVDRERLPEGGDYYASPVAAAGRIYLVNRQGTSLVLRDADRFEILATNKLDDTFDASPAVVGRRLFLRGEKYLWCVER
jgi:outer membrane protein assembly factor BamB